MILAPMATSGEEAIGSMGNDTAPAVLRDRPQLLFTYFKQLFAQVTNPPIDPIREARVMTLATTLGPGGNLLEQGPAQAHRLLLPHPVLTNEDMETLRHVTQRGSRTATLRARSRGGGSRGARRRARAPLRGGRRCTSAAGATVLIVSDRAADAAAVPIPSLLAVAAVHHHLVREQTRTGVGLVVETGEAREVAHAAQLIAFGAEAVNPYVAIDSIDALERRGLLRGRAAPTRGALRRRAVHRAAEDDREDGHLDARVVLRRPGVRGARARPDVIDAYFPNTASRIGGIGLEGIAARGDRARTRRERRRGAAAPRDAGRRRRVRVARDGPRHQWHPDAITLLRQAVQPGDEVGSEPSSRSRTTRSAARGACAACSQLRARAAPVPIAEVGAASSDRARASRPAGCPSGRSAPRRTRRSRSR